MLQELAGRRDVVQTLCAKSDWLEKGKEVQAMQALSRRKVIYVSWMQSKSNLEKLDRLPP